MLPFSRHAAVSRRGRLNDRFRDKGAQKGRDAYLFPAVVHRQPHDVDKIALDDAHIKQPPSVDDIYLLMLLLLWRRRLCRFAFTLHLFLALSLLLLESAADAASSMPHEHISKNHDD